mmetsp:Transcript_1080/g.2047  ORF Transcript_1080/g.2047 Transcript_1080/m.2047 type:complete len:234 (+) Transcript_1080:87-788(+)
MRPSSRASKSKANSPSFALFLLSIPFFFLGALLNVSLEALRRVPNVVVSACPRGVKVPRHVNALVAVPPEEVPLGLGEVGGEFCAAVRVEVGQARRQARAGHPARAGQSHHPPPTHVPRVELRHKCRVHQQVRQSGVVDVGGLDCVEKARADDAAPFPNARALREVHPPPVLGGRRFDELHALRVGANFGRVQRGLAVFQELPFVHVGDLRRPVQLGRRHHALLLSRGEVPRV